MAPKWSNMSLEDIAQYYPPFAIKGEDFYQAKETEQRIALCQQKLVDQTWLQKWATLKDRLERNTYTVTAFDTELLNGAPSFRLGIDILNNEDYLTTLSFYISVIAPFYGWYFID